ncbi:MAG: hypothetical protein RLY78_1317 [Pseudomonadota bacterium]|jgi:hypothetical protein
MSPDTDHTRRLQVTVEEVLPATGLAYVKDENQRSWALTRSTPGTGLEQLQPGQLLSVSVRRLQHAEYICAYGQPE